MSTFVQTDVGTLLGEFDLSGDHNAVGLVLNGNVKDSTQYGGSARVFKPGQPSWDAVGEGYNDFVDDGLDETLESRMALANVLLSLAPQGTADTKPAYFGQAVVAEYSPVGGVDVGEMLAFRWSATGSGKDGIVRGQIMLNAQPSANGNGTSAQLGEVGATQSVFMGLHFIAASAAITVTLESDDASDMVGSTPQITAVAQSAPGYQFLSAAGAVTDTWWRVDFATAGGTFDIIAVVGIQ